MRITFSQLKKLPIETQSGVYLGKAVDAVLSVEENLILQYKVRSHKIVGRTFLIGVSQILSISKDKVIVVDNVSVDAQAILGTIAGSET